MATKTSTYAEAFPPGDFIKEEMEARNWTQDDLAKVLGKSVRLVHEVVNAKRAVTPETAMALADAFGTSAHYWLNLENAWQLSQIDYGTDSVSRRSKLYSRFPVKEILRRGWIEESNSIDVLETRFCEFFDIQSIDDTPRLMAHFRKTSDHPSR